MKITIFDKTYDTATMTQLERRFLKTRINIKLHNAEEAKIQTIAKLDGNEFAKIQQVEEQLKKILTFL